MLVHKIFLQDFGIREDQILCVFGKTRQDAVRFLKRRTKDEKKIKYLKETDVFDTTARGIADRSEFGGYIVFMPVYDTKKPDCFYTLLHDLQHILDMQFKYTIASEDMEMEFRANTYVYLVRNIYNKLMSK